MAVSYFLYRGKGYLLQDETIHELRSGGETTLVRDLKLCRRVLARGRPVGEPEALIVAYRSDDEPTENRPEKTRERSEESVKARNWLIAFAIMVVPLIILALVFDSGLGFFVEVVSLFIVMPALLFALAFVAVVVAGFYVFVMFALRRLGWRFGT